MQKALDSNWHDGYISDAIKCLVNVPALLIAQLLSFDLKLT